MINYKKIFDLSGKKAVIVGGGGDIGGAIAEAFLSFGAKIIIADCDKEKLNEKREYFADQLNRDLLTFNVDCSEEKEVKRFYDFVISMDGIDILVNAQGINKKFAALKQPVDDWDEMFADNVKSVMLTCKYFGQHMIEKNYGKIINISSIGAVRSKRNDISACYGATKGAVNSYSLNLAAGWAQYGITVNCIAPIITDTSMMKAIFEANPELLNETRRRVPAGRICQPEDCAKAAIFLASEAASFITGQILYIDGGLSILQ